MNDIDCTGTGGRLSAELPVREPLALILMAALVCLCYANTLTNPFIFDDIPNILDNPHVRLSQITPDSLQDAAFKSPSGKRPLSNLSFALNYYLDGYNIWGYRLVNLFIHIAVGIMLYYTVKIGAAACCGRLRVAKNSPASDPVCFDSGKTAAIPFAVTLIWLVHPLQTQSVTYLVQRMNALAVLFFMLAFFLYLAADRSKHFRGRAALYISCTVCGLMALASKEIAATLPFYLLLYRWFFTLDLQWQRIRKEFFVAIAAAAVFTGVTFIFLGPRPLEAILAGYTVRPFTLTQRLLTEFRVVVFYFSLFIFPHPSRLNLDHHFLLSTTPIDPATTALSMAAICAAATGAVLLAKRHRVLSFCILWYLGNLAIESSIVGLEIIFEHRNYLPSMALALLLVWLPVQRIKSGKVLVLLFCGLSMLLAFWTFQRNKVWQDDLTLWQDCARKSPAKSRPVNKYGVALEKRGRLEEAADSYRQAIRSRQASPAPYHNLGNVLVKLGRHDEAIIQYDRALHLQPDFPDARNNLALAYARTGQVTKSIQQFERALVTEPANTTILRNLGSLLLLHGNAADALGYFKKALENEPHNVSLLLNTGDALAAMNRLDDAVRTYREALKIEPSNVMAHNSLAIVLARKGDVASAVELLRAGLKLKPDDAALNMNLKKALELLPTGD